INLRTHARKNVPWEIAKRAHRNVLSKSIQLPFRLERDHADHRTHFILAGRWSGQGVRDFVDLRHPRVALYRAHRRPERTRLAGRHGPGEEDLDAASDFVAKHQLPRQRISRLHVLARAHPGRRDIVLYSWLATLRRRFP